MPGPASKSVVEPRAVLDAAMTERQLFESVRAHLDAFKWRWYHTYDSRKSNAGFPDIVAVRGERVLFIELKKQSGVLTESQREWADALSVGFCHEYWLWRPSDLSSGEIESVLRGTT